MEKKTTVPAVAVLSVLLSACSPDESVQIDSNGDVIGVSPFEVSEPSSSIETGSTSTLNLGSTTNATSTASIINSGGASTAVSPDLGVTAAPEVVSAPEVTRTVFEEWMETPFDCGERALSWYEVNDWHYQLQSVDYEQLANSKYDLLVIDSEPLIAPNKNVINRLKCGGDDEKLLVSYLSIGQAESYRYYYGDDWEVGNPSWIVYADQFWSGDYYVRYWDPEWRQILMGTPESRVDRIVEAGFDGVYLDVIDAYTFFEEENPNAIDEMQKLIRDIAEYAREKSGNPDFGVFVQNAQELIAVVGPEWVEPLTGIGKEEAFYWAVDERVADDSRYWNELYLAQWVEAGKVVLSVDYVTTAEFRADALADARTQGFVPLMLQDKALDRMDQHADHLPD